MIDRIALVEGVFVDQGKTGAVYGAFHAQPAAECLDKCCFAGSHAAVKSEDPAIRKIVQQQAGCLLYTG